MSTLVTPQGSSRSSLTVETDLPPALSALEEAVCGIEAAPSLTAALALSEARRTVASMVAQLNRRDAQSPFVARVLAIVGRLSRVGALDLPLEDEDRDRLASWESLAWPGLVGSMLLTSAWRWAAAPLFSKVPEWLWSEYSAWLFAAPNSLTTTEDCSIHAAHLARHAGELARWTDRNVGSPCVKAAAEVFANAPVLAPLRFADVNACAAAVARGAILRRLNGRSIARHDPLVYSRIGRSLRVGFVARQWDIGPDACAALAKFEQLAPDRIERVLFAASEPATTFGWHCRDKAQEFHVLPSGLEAQITLLREMNLDVLVFAGETATPDDFSQLPAHRIAPLQVVISQTATTSGMPEADLCLVPGVYSSAGHQRFSERAGFLPAGSSSLALRRGGDSELAYARADLGFSEDDVILVAALPSVHGAGEQLSALARVLAAAGSARLVLHVLPDLSAPALGLERFCAVVQAIMTQNGVPMNRVSILAPEQATYDESRAIVRLADLLVALPGASIWAAEALSSGIPVVGLDPLAAEWLKEDRLPELAATDVESFVTTAATLVNDPARRTAVKTQLEAAVSSGLACADSLAAADGFLGAIETAFDRLELDGRSKFRRNTEPVSAGHRDELEAAVASSKAATEAGDLIAATDMAQRAVLMRPRDGSLRALYGRALLAQGSPERASVYLLAAVGQVEDDADLWYTLATSLRAEGKNSEATQALDCSLRLDPKRADGWLMLIELAEGAGASDIARDAYSALKELDPAHPQLAELALRFD